MAKRKRRGSVISDSLHDVVGSVVEHGNMTTPDRESNGPELHDSRSIRVQKRLFTLNNSSPQPAQIQRRAPSKMQPEHIHQQQSVPEIQPEQFQRQCLSEMQDEHSEQQESGYESEQDGSETSGKKMRGPATFPNQWNTGRKLDVTLNEKGLLVGEQYHELSTAVGCLARVGSAFPITKQNWSQVEKDHKEAAWQEVKNNTFLPEEAKPIVYEMLNSAWREWKYRMKKHYIKYKHDEDQMIEKLDKRVMHDQFIEAVSYWERPEVQERATVNAINRGQRKFPHRTGRTPFSEIIEDLALKGAATSPLNVWLVSRNCGKGVKEDPETANLHDFVVESINNVPIADRTPDFFENLYKDVIQKDKPGRLTCVGKTLNKKSCGSRVESSRFIQERDEIRTELNSLKEEREAITRMQEEMKQEREKEKEELSSKFKQLEGLIALYGHPSPSSGNVSCSPNISSQGHDGASLGRNISSGVLGGPNVKLLGLSIPKDTVAEGILVSRDPNAKVANVPLGPDGWKVFVKKVNNPTEKLWRKIGKLTTVGQALKKYAAWPKSDVILDEEKENDNARLLQALGR